MKSYNRFNFFKHTFCDWQLVDSNVIQQREPDYKSKSGSFYYFEQEGLYRYSNHWGRAANCRWRINKSQNQSNNYIVGYAKWQDFYPNDENSELFVICYDPMTKQVDFAHKMQDSSKQGIYRTASATSKRIAKIKQVLQNDDWFKYVGHCDFNQAQEFLINQLIQTNEDFLAIKRKLLPPL